jgi:dipeptidyl aminopeptidase/acylaminoacyl peptidase
MVKPPDFDPSRKYPVVFLVHGGPQGAWSDNFHYRWNYNMFAAPGYVVVAPNPRGSTGFGQQFTDEISRDWGGRVYTDLMMAWTTPWPSTRSWTGTGSPRRGRRMAGT